ncbi:MAG: hypothetical protein Kow0047_16080 [Anaerolineae bacterium]
MYRKTLSICGIALAIVLVMASVGAAASSGAPEERWSVVGEVVSAQQAGLTIAAADGQRYQLQLLPDARITGTIAPDSLADLVGMRVRARVQRAPDGAWVSRDVRVLADLAPLSAKKPSSASRPLTGPPDATSEGRATAAPAAACGGGGGTQPVGQWPMWAGSPRGGFYNPDELRLSPPLSPSWQLYNDNYWALNIPAIVGDVAYVGAYDGMYALDLSAQTTLWVQDGLSADNELSSPAVVDGVVYFGTWAGDLYALDAATGAILWTYSLAPADSWPQVRSPIVVNGVLYVTVEANRADPIDPSIERYVLSLYAIRTGDLAPGEQRELWHVDLAAVDGWSSISDPIYVNDAIIVGTRDQGVFAISAIDGQILWHIPHPVDAERANVVFDSYPVIAGDVAVISWTFGTYPNQWDELRGYRLDTGEQVWAYSTLNDVGGSMRFNSSALAVDGVVYKWLMPPQTTAEKTLVAIRGSDGAVLWQRDYVDNGDDGGWWWQSAANGVIYRTSAAIYVRAFSLVDGAELDAVYTGTSIEVPGAIGAGRLVVPDEEGTLWVIGGEVGVHGICGAVYSDNNLNGVRDTGEPGIPGATIQLAGVDESGTPVSDTATTNDRGEFAFLGLAPGTYTLIETDPPGFRSVAAQPGSTGGIALDANTIAEIPLASDQSSVGNDFGDVQPVDVLGAAFVDMNLNGAWDDGEPPLAGVTITLHGDHGFFQATTDEAGVFAFLEILPGTYALEEVNPEGFFSTTSDALTVPAIYPGQTYDGNLFGDAPFVTVDITVFEDQDLSGTVSGGEPGIPDVTVTLTGTDYRGTAVNLTAVADANGQIRWDQILPGDYAIHETDPADRFSTTDNDVPLAIVEPGQVISLAFGDARYVSISGLVFDDVDLDGDPTLNEGIADVQIDLRGSDYRGQLVAHTLSTDVNGRFQFPPLLPGSYQVFETNPTGFFSTTDDTMSANVPTPGASAEIAFGDARYARLSGAVYFDRDQDGQLDADEPPVPGPSLTLSGYDYTGALVLRTAQADSSGQYAFDLLRPGQYAVAEADLPGFLSVSAIPGTSGGTAVDPNTIESIQLDAGADATGYLFGDVTPPPEVGVTKRVVSPNADTVAPGQEVTYRVIVTNTGVTALTTLPLIDRPDAALSYVSASPPPDLVTSTELTWNDLTAAVGDLAPGESVVIDVSFVTQGNAATDAGWLQPLQSDGGAPECVLQITLYPTCEGWSVQFERSLSQPIPWRVTLDGTIIAEGSTRGDELISGTWPDWVDLTQPHRFRAEIKEGSRWYGRSTSTPKCAGVRTAVNRAIVTGAVDQWGVPASEAMDEAQIQIGSGSTPPPVIDWDGTLGESEPLCLREPQWITVTGVITLTPPTSVAYLQTDWYVVAPADAECPAEDPGCHQHHYQVQEITGSGPFTVTAWWPGVRPGDELVEVHIGANVLDRQGNPIHDGIGKDLYWTPQACPVEPPDSSCKPGLIGAYYKLEDDEDDDESHRRHRDKRSLYPDWDELTPVRVQIDREIYFEPTRDAFNGIEGLVDHFAVRWTGRIRIPEQGRYKFYLRSDDASRLYIDGDLVIDNDHVGGMRTESGKVDLDEGLHDVEIWFVEKEKKAGIMWGWKTPDRRKDVVPGDLLCHTEDIDEDDDDEDGEVSAQAEARTVAPELFMDVEQFIPAIRRD